jgi:hypothetical protein
MCAHGGGIMKKKIASVFILVFVFTVINIGAFAADTSSGPKPDIQAMDPARAARQAVKQDSEKIKSDIQILRNARKSGDKNAIEKAQNALKNDQEQLLKDLKVMIPVKKPLSKEEIEKLKARRAEMMEKNKARREELMNKKKANRPSEPISPDLITSWETGGK